jgi:hypothetical protein
LTGVLICSGLCVCVCACACACVFIYIALSSVFDTFYLYWKRNFYSNQTSCLTLIQWLVYIQTGLAPEISVLSTFCITCSAYFIHYTAIISLSTVHWLIFPGEENPFSVWDTFCRLILTSKRLTYFKIRFCLHKWRQYKNRQCQLHIDSYWMSVALHVSVILDHHQYL